jgi:transcriptional regulator with XRE-family HTH domain
MASGTSPTIRRRRLAAELRRLRERAGLSGEEVAERLLVSKSKISRLETGQRGVSARDVRDLLTLYGVTDAAYREELMALAQESRRRGWWSSYSDLMPGPYIGLEAEASAVWNYQAAMVPGLLQTDDYARAIIRAALVTDEAEVERRVTARLTRQERLHGETPLHLCTILDESVLYREVGGPAIMLRQLEHLAEAARLPHVTIRILPYSAGAYLAMGMPIVLLSFPGEDPGVAMVENIMGELYLEKPEEVARFTLVFDQLQAAALNPEKSLKHLQAAARTLKE